jgi:inorganic pyrophosphatase
MPATTELYCQVEVPKGAPVLNATVRDASQEGQAELRCPADWCHFPDTLAQYGTPLAAIVCVSQPGAPGGQIAVRPIALLRTHDIGGFEEIVVCVPLGDSTWAAVESIFEIPRELREEIERFATCRERSRTRVAVASWLSREEAMTAIDDAAARWAATVNGRG